MVFGHNPEIVNLVRIWKEQQNLGIERMLASALVESLKSMNLDGALTCIPTRPESYRKRGGSPLNNLLSRVAKELHCDFFPDALLFNHRVREQRTLNFAERKHNLQDAFRSEKSGLSLVLVDDVVTSGATLQAAERALQIENMVILTTALVSARQIAD